MEDAEYEEAGTLSQELDFEIRVKWFLTVQPVGQQCTKYSNNNCNFLTCQYYIIHSQV